MPIFISNDKVDKGPLKFISIGDGVTKNLSIYEYGEDIIAVDFGIGFPEGDAYGVDFVIPDMTYLLENADRVRGLFISHAHADHYAAVPYLLEQLNLPIYANKLTTEYVKESLDEKQFKKLKSDVSYHLFDATTAPVKLGAFTISAFNINHSVPGSLGIVIDTPEGRMLHIADFKIDSSPVIDPPADLNKIAEICKNGVLCLASDSLGARTKGAVPSESSLNETFPKVFDQFEGKQLFITTISSNISRMYQIIDSAVKKGRKVVAAGRSIDFSIKTARSLGYLPFEDDAFVDLKDAQDYAQDSVVYIIAGCFGQQGSALDRLSRSEHQDISLDEGAVVIYSSEPNPPGVDVDVERVSANLILGGAEVYDHMNMDHLHVSGHGHRDELLKMAQIVKPKYYIPIGGGVIHLHAYANMIYDSGIEKGRVFELQEGDSIEFKDGIAKRGKKIEVTDMFYDGIGLSPVVVKDRVALSEDGVFVVVVPVSKETKTLGGSVDIITRGFIYVKESKALLGQTRDVINKVLDKNQNVVDEWGSIKQKIEKDVYKFLYKETKRTPLIIVHSIFI